MRLAEALCGDHGPEVAIGWNFGPFDEDCKPVSYVVDRLVKGWEGAEWHLSAGPHPHEASFLKVDASRARARLGWRPKLRLEEALDWTVGWYRGVQADASASALCQQQIAAYEAI